MERTQAISAFEAMQEWGKGKNFQKGIEQKVNFFGLRPSNNKFYVRLRHKKTEILAPSFSK